MLPQRRALPFHPSRWPSRPIRHFRWDARAVRPRPGGGRYVEVDALRKITSSSRAARQRVEVRRLRETSLFYSFIFLSRTNVFTVSRFTPSKAMASIVAFDS